MQGLQTWLDAAGHRPESSGVNGAETRRSQQCREDTECPVLLLFSCLP